MSVIIVKKLNVNNLLNNYKFNDASNIALISALNKQNNAYTILE